MTDKEYFDRSVEMIRTEWFPKHQAVFGEYPSLCDRVGNKIPGITDKIEFLLWANPENSNYQVKYFLHRATLFVTGDVGHAIYRWSNTEHGLEWIANCNYHYFDEKIEGLNGYFDSRSWRGDICKQRAEEFFKSQERKPRIPSYWSDHVNSRDEWMRFVHDHYKVFGVDNHDPFEWGFVPNTRCIGHWLGLRMAFAIPTA